VERVGDELKVGGAHRHSLPLPTSIPTKD
jgi:hypothetical protein